MSIAKSKPSAAVVETYKRALGLDHLPLFWSEEELHQLNIANRYSLRRDRANRRGIPFQQDRPRGRVRYLALDVLTWLEENKQAAHTGNETADSRQDLQKWCAILPPTAKKELLELIAQISEKSYRRGAQQLSCFTKIAVDLPDLSDWRFSTPIEQSPGLLEWDRDNSAVDRVKTHHRFELSELGL